MELARHTASARASHARIVSPGQAVHVSHLPSSAPVQPRARYRCCVHVLHSRQCVAPTPLWYVPELHRRHAEEGGLGLYVPAAHGKHTASLLGWQLSPHEKPAAHVWQWRQAVAPGADWNLPEPQVSHAGVLGAPVKLPGRQAAHPLSADARHAEATKFPAAHVRHGLQAVPRAPVWYVPPAQVAHAVSPALEANVPDEQLVQTPSASPLHPLAHTWPLTHVVHGWQAVRPGSRWNEPAAHASQSLELPVLAWNFPASHGTHDADPCAGW